MTQALTFIEIDIPFCELTYGVAPCTASLVSSPPTGTIKCFNVRSTCQDRVNYDEGEVTLRFSKSAEFYPREIDALPFILSVSFSPAIVSLGQDLGQRATLSVTFRDQPHSDTGQGYDKYLADRDYDPFSQGTYWGKFRSRQKFLQGRELRWIQGEVGDAIEDMVSRRFLIEGFTGPTREGVFTITAKDVLKLGDGDRALAPLPSNGFLSADLSAIATSATLLPSGIGNDEYEASGYLAIGGNEVVSFTRAADVLTIARGALGSTATTHKASDRVQTVLRYAGIDPALILQDLLEGYAEVPPSDITIADWTDETGTFLGNLYTATICEPTSVRQLCSELIEQAALSIWDDSAAGQLRLQVLRAVVTEADTFTPDNTLAGTLQIKDQPEKRVSRVLTYFGQKDPTKPLSNLDNYRSTSLRVDDDAEEDYGAIAIKTITSRWIPDGGRSIADRLGDIIIGRFRDPPRNLQFKLQRFAETDPELGIGYRVEAVGVQDATGAASNIPIQVTRLNPADNAVEAEEMLWTAPAADTGVRYLIFDSDINNINLRASHDLLYSAPQSGDVVNCIINSGVTVGSVSSLQRSLDVGSWPSGVDITIFINGNILAAGGYGGEGGGWFGGTGSNGLQGGTALYTRYPVDLEFPSGTKLWGGGGGGAGGGGGGGTGGGGGGGGGGGAGRVPGNGAAGGGVNTGTHGVAGSVGTETAGGAGGTGGAGGYGPPVGYGGNAGAGGGPGLAGSGGSAGAAAGVNSGGPAGSAGAAGVAIDGVSFVTTTVSGGDLRGTQIN